MGFLRSFFGTSCVGVFSPLALQHPQVEQDTILRLELPGEEFSEQAKAQWVARGREFLQWTRDAGAAEKDDSSAMRPQTLTRKSSYRHALALDGLLQSGLLGGMNLFLPK